MLKRDFEDIIDLMKFWWEITFSSSYQCSFWSQMEFFFFPQKSILVRFCPNGEVFLILEYADKVDRSWQRSLNEADEIR